MNSGVYGSSVHTRSLTSPATTLQRRLGYESLWDRAATNGLSPKDKPIRVVGEDATASLTNNRDPFLFAALSSLFSDDLAAPMVGRKGPAGCPRPPMVSPDTAIVLRFVRRVHGQPAATVRNSTPERGMWSCAVATKAT